jgi:methionyl-tRNA formyltransferase
MNNQKLKVLFMGGNHPRHLHYANALHSDFGLVGVVIQKRGKIMPSVPTFQNEREEENYYRHFNDRAAAEEKYFGEQNIPNCEAITIEKEALNTEVTMDFVKKINPDVIFIFGCGMINTVFVDHLPFNTINLHLGLSPRYRGSATLFWPFYFLEPNYAGSTFHYITQEADAGDIIHQVRPELEVGDQIHDVAYKIVLASAQEGVRLLDHFQEKGTWNKRVQKSTGKHFLDGDFRPEHLSMIYDVYDNDVVNHYLEKKIQPREPKLFKQF